MYKEDEINVIEHTCANNKLVFDKLVFNYKHDLELLVICS